MRFLVVLALLTIAAGCDSATGQEQQLFDTTAQLEPSDGITPDDWRIGPAFGGRVSVTPPSPNPAPRTETDVTLVLSGDDRTGGLDLYRRTASGSLQLVQSRGGGAGASFYTFLFSPGDVATSPEPESVRLVVLDRSQRAVTYGDLVIQ